MKFLITGSAGLVGRQLARDLSESSQVYSCYRRARPEYGIPTPMDLARPDDIGEAISRVKPDVIFHLAAISDADTCEREKGLATAINVRATEEIARQAARLRSFLVYLSTDQIFDGKGRMRRESDRPNPVNHYGRTKLEGEGAVQDLSSKWCIARTSVVYGYHPARTNFLASVASRLLSGEKCLALEDQHVSPTYLPNLSRMLSEMGTRQIAGVIHLAGGTRVSRYEMARMLSERLGLDARLLTRAKMSDMKDWSAPRPHDSSLDTTKAGKILKERPLPFEAGLELYARQLRARSSSVP